jgi:hypothetical protein
MRVNKAFSAALLAAACQANPAPKQWLPTPDQAPAWTHGGWIDVVLRDSALRGAASFRAGELLAVSPDSVWVLTEQGAVGVAAADAGRATVIGWDPETYLLTAWTLIGTVSTLSNGAFLLFTAPAWLIGGGLTTAAQSKRPVLRTDRNAWLELRLYARFPQGLPPGLDLTTLGSVQLGRPVR